jgi:hypothetical protein
LGNQIAAADSATSTKYYGPVVFTEGYYIPNEMKVAVLRPNSDINSNWTTTGANRWSTVDDAPPDDTGYISSTTLNQTQTMGMTDVTLSTGQVILGVQAGMRTIPGPYSNGYAGLYIQDSGGTNSTLQFSANTSTGGPYWTMADRPLLLDPDGASWTESVLNGCRTHLNQESTADSKVSEISWRVAIMEPGVVAKALTATLSFTSAQTRKIKDTLTAALSFTSAQTRRNIALFRESFSASISPAGAWRRVYTAKIALTAALSFTGGGAQYMWKQIQDAGGWFVRKGRLRRRRPY